MKKMDLLLFFIVANFTLETSGMKKTTKIKKKLQLIAKRAEARIEEIEQEWKRFPNRSPTCVSSNFTKSPNTAHKRAVHLVNNINMLLQMEELDEAKSVVSGSETRVGMTEVMHLGLEIKSLLQKMYVLLPNNRYSLKIKSCKESQTNDKETLHKQFIQVYMNIQRLANLL